MKNMSQSTDPQFPPHENTPLITTAQPGSAYLLESITGEEISSNLKPLDALAAEHAALQAEIEKLMLRWEELMTAAEALQRCV